MPLKRGMGQRRRRPVGRRELERRLEQRIRFRRGIRCIRTRPADCGLPGIVVSFPVPLRSKIEPKGAKRTAAVARRRSRSRSRRRSSQRRSSSTKTATRGGGGEGDDDPEPGDGGPPSGPPPDVLGFADAFAEYCVKLFVAGKFPGKLGR